MLRGISGDPERYRETYWERFPGKYFAGDGAKRDEDGYYWLLGRVDDARRAADGALSLAPGVNAVLMTRLRVELASGDSAAVRAVLDDRTQQVLHGRLAASTAARELLALFSGV